MLYWTDEIEKKTVLASTWLDLKGKGMIEKGSDYGDFLITDTVMTKSYVSAFTAETTYLFDPAHTYAMNIKLFNKAGDLLPCCIKLLLLIAPAFHFYNSCLHSNVTSIAYIGKKKI